jgi:hypothetical protein
MTQAFSHHCPRRRRHRKTKKRFRSANQEALRGSLRHEGGRSDLIVAHKAKGAPRLDPRNTFIYGLLLQCFAAAAEGTKMRKSIMPQKQKGTLFLEHLSVLVVLPMTTGVGWSVSLPLDLLFQSTAKYSIQSPSLAMSPRMPDAPIPGFAIAIRIIAFCNDLTSFFR